MRNLLVAALLASALTACGSLPSPTSNAPAKVADGALVGANGMTLYTFDKDPVGSGKSVCNGPCATNWPPLTVADGATASGPWTIITRDDGKKQWAHKGMPVYFWIKDAKPGDRTGDGVNNVWKIARP